MHSGEPGVSTRICGAPFTCLMETSQRPAWFVIKDKGFQVGIVFFFFQVLNNNNNKNLNFLF